jgi:hypothetical protein
MLSPIYRRVGQSIVTAYGEGLIDLTDRVKLPETVVACSFRVFGVPLPVNNVTIIMIGRAARPKSACYGFDDPLTICVLCVSPYVCHGQKEDDVTDLLF